MIIKIKIIAIIDKIFPISVSYLLMYCERTYQDVNVYNIIMIN